MPEYLYLGVGSLQKSGILVQNHVALVVICDLAMMESLLQILDQLY